MSNTGAKTSDIGLSHTAVAFAAAAAVAVIFNTLLAGAQDKFPVLNTWMAQPTGHHWITHGLAVIAVFFLVGFFLKLRSANAINGDFKPTLVLFGSVLVAGAGLLAWFYYV
jgi:hypothetical protein